MKILVADDEQLVLQDTVEMLENIDIVGEVVSFCKAKEALGYALMHDVDVAILDIDMPGMSGLALAQEMIAHNPDIDIVFSTGFSEFALDAYKVRASGYLMKPVKKVRLEEELQHIALLRKERVHA